MSELSIRKLMSVVKDVDLEAMPSSILSMMMMMIGKNDLEPINTDKPFYGLVRWSMANANFSG